MENVIKNIKGDAAENQVYSAFTKLWHGKRGVLLHSFKPENVLSPLTKRANAQRDTSTDLTYTSLETKISEIFGIEIEAEAKSIISKIKQISDLYCITAMQYSPK